MSLPKFDYIKAENITQACKLLAEHKNKARVIAGGTDLLVKMKENEVKPEYLIGLKGIPGLNKVTFDKKEGLRIGCLATHSNVINSRAVQQNYESLAEALESIGTPQIRNLGTVGGNLCNGSPAADSAPILIALGARVRIAGLNGEKEMLLERFFSCPGKTVLKTGEIVIEIIVPAIKAHSHSKYEKLSLRSSADIAAVSAACWVQINPRDNTIADIKIALGAAAPVPVRAKRAEKMLKNKTATEDLIEKAALLASKEAKPITDLRASAEYRKEMLRVMARRAINGALQTST